MTGNVNERSDWSLRCFFSIVLFYVNRQNVVLGKVVNLSRDPFTVNRAIDFNPRFVVEDECCCPFIFVHRIADRSCTASQFKVT